MSLEDFAVWAVNQIMKTEWLDLIKTLAPVATATIAFTALKNWKRQDKAKREAEFLDALIDAMHTYVAHMSKPIGFLEVIKIGFESYIPIGQSEDPEVKGAIAYIQKNGEQISSRLRESLETARPSVAHLRALITKGQVFEFNNYRVPQNAVTMLTRQFDIIEAFGALIGSSTLNWAHPKVLEALKNVMSTNPNDIRSALQKDNVTILEFAQETYKKLYR